MASIRVMTVVAALLASVAAHAATFNVVNQNGAGVGLNDPAPFTPVGGNNATTLGQARLNVINEAARIWGEQLSSSQVIVIDAQFAAQTCTATSGTLASARPLTFFTGGPLPLPGVLYPAALADALTGQNNNSRDDIVMTVNSTVGTDPGCLGGHSFYLGLDHQNGSSIDLLATLLHEIGHGLGFESLTDQNGASLASDGELGIFDQYIYSETTGKFWPAMSNAERAAASISNGALTWNHAAVNEQICAMTDGVVNGHLRLYAPAIWADGSSVSHWDTVATPDLLMEPFLRPNPRGLTDITGCVLQGLGWTGTHCPDSDGPVQPAATPQTVAAVEDMPAQITLRGTAASCGALTYSLSGAPALGTLATSASPTSSGGVLYTYTPFANANGTDSFSFQVSSGGVTSSAATVIINIAAVNDAPVANAQSVASRSGAAVAIGLSASDVDNDALSFAVATAPANGTLSGTAPNLVYTSNSGFSGSDSFTFRASDGKVNSAPATVTINVAAAPAGGGGAVAARDLLLLALLLLCPRRKFFRRTA